MIWVAISGIVLFLLIGTAASWYFSGFVCTTRRHACCVSTWEELLMKVTGESILATFPWVFSIMILLGFCRARRRQVLQNEVRLLYSIFAT